MPVWCVVTHVASHVGVEPCDSVACSLPILSLARHVRTQCVRYCWAAPRCAGRGHHQERRLHLHCVPRQGAHDRVTLRLLPVSIHVVCVPSASTTCIPSPQLVATMMVCPLCLLKSSSSLAPMSAQLRHTATRHATSTATTSTTPVALPLLSPPHTHMDLSR
jgi:hypothetical protein